MGFHAWVSVDHLLDCVLRINTINHHPWLLLRPIISQGVVPISGSEHDALHGIGLIIIHVVEDLTHLEVKWDVVHGLDQLTS